MMPNSEKLETREDVHEIHFEEGCLYEDADGRRVEYPPCCEKTINQIARLEKKLARQVKGSNGYHDTECWIADARRRLKDQYAQLIRTEANRLLATYSTVMALPADVPEGDVGTGKQAGIPWRANYNKLRKVLRSKQKALKERGISC